MTGRTADQMNLGGWVTAQFPEGKVPPIDVLKAWIDESYRAQAPKKLLKSIAVASTGPEPAKRPAATERLERATKKSAQKRVPKSRTPMR